MRALDPGHRDHLTSLGVHRYRNRLRPGTGPVPLQSNRNRRRLAAEPGLLHPVPVADRAARPARASSRTRGSRFPAAAAEPPGPGLGRARDPLAHEVRFLGSLLGQVIAEQAGPELFATVERIRRRTIALRRGDPEVVLEPDIERERLGAEIGSLDVEHAAAVARAFTLYFQLVNLAEERQRIRMLRTRARRAKGRPIDESLGEAVERLAAVTDRAGARGAAPHGRGPPGPHRPPDGGPAPHAARRAAPDPAAAGLARRPADDARRGRGPAATPARGDHAAVAHRRPAGRAADAARRGAIGARDLRRDAVHRRPPLRPGARPGARFGRGRRWARRRRRAAGAGRRRRADRDPPRRGAVAAAVRLVDRLRSRRAPGRHGRDHPPCGSAPGRPPPPRLRGGRLAADADRRRARRARARRPGARPRPRARRGGAARDDAPAPTPLPRGAVPAAAGRDRGAASGGPGRR